MKSDLEGGRQRDMLQVAGRFDIPGDVQAIAPYGNGHINDTFLVTTPEGRLIMQRVNRYVFPEPVQVIRNIEQVTAYLRGVIEREGGDPLRQTLTLVPAQGGEHYVIDGDGELWRMYLFIEGTISCDLPDTTALFELSGEAFGRFQRQLGGFEADALSETIRDFHNTPARYAQLMDAASRDAAGRLSEVGEELAFCRRYEREVHALLDALAAGEIPLRVTHNDTKLNNVLLDAKTGRGVCVIDLDTVMPGLAAYDFGDSIRSGANTAEEDEPDLSKVRLSLPMFEAFARGFLREAGAALNAREVELLPMGAKLMTLECGMRFLADHLNGDKYFKIHRPGHNLCRARTQFALVREMEKNWEAMCRIVREAAAGAAR